MLGCESNHILHNYLSGVFSWWSYHMLTYNVEFNVFLVVTDC